MNNSAAVARVKVSADGHGVVSHAGVGSLQAMAGPTGLSAQVTGRTGGRVSGPWTYAPGAVFADLAAAVAGEADCERLPPHFPSIPNPPIRDDSPPGRQWAEVLVLKCLAVSTCA